MAALLTQADAVTWLNALVGPDAPRGEAALEVSQALFEALGNPQDAVPAVHIVGTAGKGSVAGSLTAGLVASGQRVASHLSPHVYDIRERFLLDGRLPEWPVVVDAINAVAVAATGLGRPPTFFAATAATAIQLGRTAGVDRLVIEAGIGGRVDATNVFRRADVLTIITSIGLDHTDVLGTTVEAIAAEKASVLAGRQTAVLGPQPSTDAANTIRRFALTHDIQLVEVSATGDFRLDAAATAAAALELIGGDAVSTPTPLSGRFEELELLDRHIILDGAHNPMKLATLAETLAQKPALVIAAVGVGKDLDGCAAVLARLGETIIATTFAPEPGKSGPHSRTTAELADALRQAGAARCIESPIADLAKLVQNETKPGEVILVTGSFLHLADVRRRLSSR